MELKHYGRYLNIDSFSDPITSMKRIFQIFSRNRTFRANAIMVGGNFFANIGAYLYHLSMGRLLIPGDYGALQSLISLTNIFTVPLLTLNFIITKYISSYVGRDEFAKISYLFHSTRKILLIILFIGGSVFFLFSKPILSFLHIDSWINFLFLDIVLFFGLLTTLNRAALQGLSKFGSLTVVQFIDSYGKLILGLIAVIMGLRVPGAFGAFVLIYFVSYVYTNRILERLIPKNETSSIISLRQMANYGILSFFMTISMMSLYNVDVVLVRHYFSSYESGLYAALSVLGKIIFFGSSPISVAMFPLVSEAQVRGEKYHRIFLQSLLFIVLIAGFATLLFSLYPVTAIKILVGVKYLPAAPYLAMFSLFLSLCAVVNLFVNFFLSVHKSLPAYIMVSAALLQVVLISLFHTSLFTVILISVSTLSVLSVVLLGYYVATSKV